MLKIKLARFGKRGQPHYRFVITKDRSKRDSNYIESIGHYAPTQNPKVLVLDLEKYDEWLKKGAQPTDTVAGLAKRVASGNPFPEKPKKPSRKALAKAANKAEEKVAETETTTDKGSEGSEEQTKQAETKNEQKEIKEETTEEKVE
ncbi:MAG: 30S ribosomal protein S16 [Pseudomonadales bacterium]|nr:30S ribosomal protein S16 [Candidatus Woesebacteria bacterium]MCB9802299.1 30S ribosomal protein S16 [Pseudomonadales bacterium]